jgi:hypothetical protein
MLSHVRGEGVLSYCQVFIALPIVLPSPAKSCQVLPSPAKSCQVLPSPAKSCQVLSSPTKSYQVLPIPANSCQVLPSPAKSIQDRSSPAKSGILTKKTLVNFYCVLYSNKYILNLKVLNSCSYTRYAGSIVLFICKTKSRLRRRHCGLVHHFKTDPTETVAFCFGYAKTLQLTMKPLCPGASFQNRSY